MNIRSINYLKLFAFFLVFISHSFFSSRTMYLGAFGVSLFIIVSGFLYYFNNYSSTVSRNRIKITIIKFFNILPLHLLLFFVSLLISNVVFNITFVYKVITNVLMVQSFIPNMDYYFSFNSVSWYLTLVIFFSLISKRMCKLVNQHYKVLLVIMPLFLISYYLLTRNLNTYHWHLYISPLFRLSDFLIGMIVAKLSMEYKINDINPCFLIIPFLTALLSIIIKNNIFYQLAWIPSSIVLILFFYNTIKKNYKILNFISKYNLELFLSHQIIIKLLWTLFPLKGGILQQLFIALFRCYLAFALSLLFAVSYKSIVRFCYEYYAKQSKKTI